MFDENGRKRFLAASDFEVSLMSLSTPPHKKGINYLAAAQAAKNRNSLIIFAVSLMVPFLWGAVLSVWVKSKVKYRK